MHGLMTAIYNNITWQPVKETEVSGKRMRETSAVTCVCVYVGDKSSSSGNTLVSFFNSRTLRYTCHIAKFNPYPANVENMVSF